MRSSDKLKTLFINISRLTIINIVILFNICKGPELFKGNFAPKNSCIITKL